MHVFLIIAVACMIAPSALAAIKPRASPVCTFVCNPHPPATAPGGQFLGQSTSGPFIECDYHTTDLYGTGPSNYGCLYTMQGVSLDDPTYCPELINTCSTRKRRAVEGVPKRRVRSGKPDARGDSVNMARFGKRVKPADTKR